MNIFQLQFLIIVMILFLSKELLSQEDPRASSISDNAEYVWNDYLEDFTVNSAYQCLGLRNASFKPKNQSIVIENGELIASHALNRKSSRNAQDAMKAYDLIVSGECEELHVDSAFEISIKYKVETQHEYNFKIRIGSSSGDGEVEFFLEGINRKSEHGPLNIVTHLTHSDPISKSVLSIGELEQIEYDSDKFNTLKISFDGDAKTTYTLNDEVFHEEILKKIDLTSLFFFMSEHCIKGEFNAKMIIDNISVKKLENKNMMVSQELMATPVITAVKPSPLGEDEEQITYHALIIGNNNYEDENLLDLDQPIDDAIKLYDVLTAKYTFEKENVVFLKDASRKEIIAALDDLSDDLTEDDNLLIFYAGHGHWKEKKETGYWLPVDAESDITANWLRNSTIRGYIDDIDAKHTLLIADACFGGGIFKTRSAFDDADRSIRNLYKYESRKAMTSGMLNEVPDRSIFMENLTERLSDNEEKYLPSYDLFYQFRESVMNNSNNAPQYGTVHHTGDKGGDFIFILREVEP